MTTTPTAAPATGVDPNRTPAHRGWTVLLVLLIALVCGVHAWLLWTSMEGWQGLTNGWPLWRFDHPLYYHSALVTRGFLVQSFTTAGYDPAFMAGYPKSVIFPTSSTLPELVLFIFRSGSPELTYKIYVLVSALVVPWLVVAAGRLWRVGPGAMLAAVALHVAYFWNDFPVSYTAYGMLPYLLSIPLGLFATGVFHRYCEGCHWGWWLFSAMLLTFMALVHVTSILIVGPAAAAEYLAAASRSRTSPDGRKESRWRFHGAVGLIVVLVIALNGFWWAPGFWLAATKGPSDFAFSHKEGVWIRLWQIFTREPLCEPWLCVLGLLGLGLLVWKYGRGAAGLVVFVVSGFVWGYLSAGFRNLDFLQPGRHTYAFYTGLAVAGGYALARVARRDGSLTRAWLGRVTLVATLGGLVWTIGPQLHRQVKARVYAPFPILASRPSPYLLWVFDQVEQHVKRGERLLYEEGGFGIPGQLDPFQGGRFSGILADRFGIELIGGPYLHASLTTNFTQFGENRLFENLEWDRNWFVRYARIYRPDAIVCWTKKARAFCFENPDLIEVLADGQPVLIGRVRGFGGAAVVGQAEVEASSGRLRVRRAEGGLDGTVVLRYHSVPCLRSDPPMAWDPVFLENDPVPFIRLRPPLGPVTFELRFPPPARGAPARSSGQTPGRGPDVARSSREGE